MSKAFTREDSEEAATLGRVVVRSAVGEERPITREGHRALIEKRDAWLTERSALPPSADRARELDHRLALITATLESVRIVEHVGGDGRAHFGSTVTLRWDDGRTQRIVLVGPDEAEGDRISIASPLGRAVAGARLGAVVEIDRPRGVAEATLVAIERAVRQKRRM